MDFDDEIREFLIESNENLATLDQEIVQLEQRPDDADLISSAFRTIHTIKGTCGFFGFDLLSGLTHVTENILSQVRAGQRTLTPELISLFLESVDQIKALLICIETTGSEGPDNTAELRSRLDRAYAEGSARRSSDDSDAPSLGATQDQTLRSCLLSPQGLSVNDHLPPAPTTEHCNVTCLPQPDVALLPTPAPSSAAPGDQSRSIANTPSAEADASSSDTAREAQLADTTIRVDVALLNRLMNLVGELVLARNQLLQETASHDSPLQQTSQRLNLITSELQEGLMKTRMQPIGIVWSKLPRVVRDLAFACGKRVQLLMEGGSTELDKTILEAIKDPLTHIVRNSCDHGIELPQVREAKGKHAEGTLMLRSYHEGGVVNIEISDDGAGIDAEKVKTKAIEKGILSPEQALQLTHRDALHLIFKPGFSTAAQVTSISGRGVGMDVVKTNIERIGGSVEVSNRAEGGTKVRIKIPLTLAIVPGLVVTLARNNTAASQTSASLRTHERFIIPQANLLELVRIEGAGTSKRIDHVHGTPIFHHRGKLLPLVYLRQVLGQTSLGTPSDDVTNIIVLQAEQRQLGLVVDQICDTQEIVVKPLGRQLKGIICYAGATIMGDGRPALILDVVGIARLAGLGGQVRQAILSTESVPTTSLQAQQLLLFSAGVHTRLAVPLSLVDRLEEIDVTRLERADGRPVLHYRDDILPLISLSSHLDQAANTASGTTQVIVFSNGHKRIGLLVDKILDIVSEKVEVRRAPTQASSGMLGSMIVGGKITDLLDLHALAEQVGENWLDATRAEPARRTSLLLVDPAPITREMTATFLSASGFEVHPVSSASEAHPLLRERSHDAVLVATAVPPDDKRSLQGTLVSTAHTSLLELLDNEEQRDEHASPDAILRSDRHALLHRLCALTQNPKKHHQAA